MKVSNHKIIKYLLSVFFLWKVILLAAALLSPLIPLRDRYTYSDGPGVSNPVILWNRANFDGAHYLQITRNGYGLYQQAFFPFYPRLIHALTPLFLGRDLLAALFISNVALCVCLFFFYKLISLDYGQKTARWGTVFFLFFPTAFFLGAVYTESLFLALVMGSFYAARTRKWFLAGILGGFASYTRVSGILLFPALIWELYQQNKSKNFLPLLIAPLGLVNYMWFLWQNYKDPLLFVHVQANFGLQRSSHLILLYQVFWRYWKMILTTKADVLYFAVWLELLTAIGFLFLLFIAIKKGVRASYLIFTALAYLLPTLSGTFCSMPRFALTFFPGFIVLGMSNKDRLKKAVMSAFVCLLIVSAILFFRGYWIS